MAEIMKKKKNEVIQKVKVKMLCGCNCINQNCVCNCTMKTKPTVTERIEVDADRCERLHSIISEHTEVAGGQY